MSKFTLKEVDEVEGEYEIKTADLRVYLMKYPEGHVIIMGGKKNTQREDIRKFRSIKKQYLNQH